LSHAAIFGQKQLFLKMGSSYAYADLKQYLEALEGRLAEKMRDMQTELLRGFAAFSEGQTIRLRKVEVDQSNLDAALSGRLNVVEGRLGQIELRQGILRSLPKPVCELYA
jgi:hypothetical protein